MSELVSIIINCHNGQEYLKECLDSVLKQSYQNWEVVFWDNQSTDDSAKIFQSYRNTNFKYYLANEFTNLSRARNLAIEKSNGNLVAFLDVDDIWHVKKLEKQIELFKKKNSSLTFTNFYIFKNNLNKKKIYIKKIPNEDHLTNLLKNYYIGLLTIMFDKRKIDYNFNEKYHFIGDFDFVMKVASKKKIDFVDEPLAYNRLHMKNETKKKYVTSNLEILNWYKLCDINEIKNNINFSYVKSTALYNLTKATIYKKKRLIITKRYKKLTYFQIFKLSLHYLKVILKL